MEHTLLYSAPSGLFSQWNVQVKSHLLRKWAYFSFIYWHVLCAARSYVWKESLLKNSSLVHKGLLSTKISPTHPDCTCGLLTVPCAAVYKSPSEEVGLCWNNAALQQHNMDPHICEKLNRIHELSVLNVCVLSALHKEMADEAKKWLITWLQLDLWALFSSFFCPERRCNHLRCFWGSATQSHSWVNLPIGDSPALSIWLDLHRSLPANVSVIPHYGTSLICELEANITFLMLSFSCCCMIFLSKYPCPY